MILTTSPEPSAAMVGFGGVRVRLRLRSLGGRLLDFTVGNVTFPRLYKRRGREGGRNYALLGFAYLRRFLL